MTEIDGQGPNAMANARRAYELSRNMGLVDRVKTLGESAIFLLKSTTLQQVSGAGDYYEPGIQAEGEGLVERASARSIRHSIETTFR